MGRTFAIGDIHGCSNALKALLDAIDPGPDDTIISLGDVVDWGPDTRGAMAQLIDLADRCRFILVGGNHEQMLLEALAHRNALAFWLRVGGDATLRSYGVARPRGIDPAHVRFLRERAVRYHETDGYLFVHASYEWYCHPGESSDAVLRWEFAEPEAWRPHVSGKTVVAGHTTQDGGQVRDLGFAVLLDTGASLGGWLTALEVDTGEIVQADQQGRVRRSRRVRREPDAPLPLFD